MRSTWARSRLNSALALALTLALALALTLALALALTLALTLALGLALGLALALALVLSPTVAGQRWKALPFAERESYKTGMTPLPMTGRGGKRAWVYTPTYISATFRHHP